jgi:hypothetical protein
MSIEKGSEYGNKWKRNSYLMDQIWFGNSCSTVCPDPNLVRHMFWPREDEEGNGLRKPVADADRRISARRQAHRHLGPRHAVRQPPAASRQPIPSCFYLFIRPGPSARLHTFRAHPGSRKRLRRRVPLLRPPDATPRTWRERSAWLPQWSTTLVWTPSRSASCSKTSEPSFLPRLLLLPPANFRSSSTICLSPTCSGYAHRYLLDFSGAWGRGFRSRLHSCLLRRISPRSERGHGLGHGGCSVCLTLCQWYTVPRFSLTVALVWCAVSSYTRAVGLAGQDCPAPKFRACRACPVCTRLSRSM